MNWITLFENDFFKIETNGKIVESGEFLGYVSYFTFEKSFIKITSKD